jgi:hypothetical protein
VLQHDDFQLLEVVGAATQDGQAQNVSKYQVAERDEHESSSASDTGSFYTSVFNRLLDQPSAIPGTCGRGFLHPSPCQNPYAERLIGSIRRECLDHVIVLGEQHLRRILASYSVYYRRARTHLSLAKDAPTPRHVQDMAAGHVVAFAEVGGLHHRYERRAA